MDLTRYFTNSDDNVFGLRNLPEATKGALFARYSRSGKGLREIFAEEFAFEERTIGYIPTFDAASAAGDERAAALYRKVLDEYGDDSVAQLGSLHLAVEGASNILTKILEWGRLKSYLEQSTRYIPFDMKPYRFHTPVELVYASPALHERYRGVMTRLFDTYAKWLPRATALFEQYLPDDPAGKRAARAKALDAVRVLLPASTTANLGIHGTGQAIDQLILQLLAAPEQEANATGRKLLREARKVAPVFFNRSEERQATWVQYLRETREKVAKFILPEGQGYLNAPRRERNTVTHPMVSLFPPDPEGELLVAAKALFKHTGVSEQVLFTQMQIHPDFAKDVIRTYAGDRENRRHRPGRAFEAVTYRFELLQDYGVFRDLQRHRMLTLDWQPLTARHGYIIPDVVNDLGPEAFAEFQGMLEEASDLYEEVLGACGPYVAQYCPTFGFLVRFYMDLNARELMHVAELRTQPAGHPNYRRACQDMVKLVEAHHPTIVETMKFVNREEVTTGRLAAEQRSEARRQS